MNFGETEKYLRSIVRDHTIPLDFKRQINVAIFEVASNFELPNLKLAVPVPLSVDKSTWLWQMPDSFHKKLFEVRRVHQDGERQHWRYVEIRDHIEDLNLIDPAHQRVEDHVTQVAVDDYGDVTVGQRASLGIYPLPWRQELLQLFFYRKPTYLMKPGDFCDAFPAEFMRTVVVPKCLIMNFENYTDGIEDGPMKSLQYWEGRYNVGLYGERMGDIGLVNYLAKRRGGSRRHGGRDPIGPGRGYFGGYR